MIYYTKKNGKISEYDNHSIMNKSYQKLREKYRSRVTCPDCHIEYTQNNKFAHVHSKKHIDFCKHKELPENTHEEVCVATH